MQRSEIESALDRAETSLTQGKTALGPSGFWKAVSAVKRDRALIDDYADRISQIDRIAFERWAWLSLPAAAGTTLMLLGTLVGLAFVLWAYSLDQPWNGIMLLIGTGITIVTTHGLAHMADAEGENESGELSGCGSPTGSWRRSSGPNPA